MRLVMKFGGTAVDSPDKVRHIAQLIQSHKKGNEIVCVVSAVRGMTDGLLSIADSVKRGDKTSLDEFVEKFFPILTYKLQRVRFQTKI